MLYSPDLSKRILLGKTFNNFKYTIIQKANPNHWEPFTILVTSNVAPYNLLVSFDISKTVALFMLSRIQDLIQIICLIKKTYGETVSAGEVIHIKQNPTRAFSHWVHVRGISLKTLQPNAYNIYMVVLLCLTLQGLAYPQ